MVGNIAENRKKLAEAAVDCMEMDDILLFVKQRLIERYQKSETEFQEDWVTYMEE